MQHFKPISFGSKKISKEKKLSLTKKKDTIRNEYCMNKGINLLRIPYTKLKNIDVILYKTLMEHK